MANGKAKAYESLSIGADGMTLSQVCPKCGRANLVVLPACCKYEKLGWEILKKCPLRGFCNYVEKIL